MTQTFSPAHDHRPGFWRSQGLALAAVGAAASMLTAAAMGGNRADIPPLMQAATPMAPATAAVCLSNPTHVTITDDGSLPANVDFALQEPAPTF